MIYQEYIKKITISTNTDETNGTMEVYRDGTKRYTFNTTNYASAAEIVPEGISWNNILLKCTSTGKRHVFNMTIYFK